MYYSNLMSYKLLPTFFQLSECSNLRKLKSIIKGLLNQKISSCYFQNVTVPSKTEKLQRHYDITLTQKAETSL